MQDGGPLLRADSQSGLRALFEGSGGGGIARLLPAQARFGGRYPAASAQHKTPQATRLNRPHEDSTPKFAAYCQITSHPAASIIPLWMMPLIG